MYAIKIIVNICNYKDVKKENEDETQSRNRSIKRALTLYFT
jgi:hypothetical protein